MEDTGEAEPLANGEYDNTDLESSDDGSRDDEGGEEKGEGAVCPPAPSVPEKQHAGSSDGTSSDAAAAAPTTTSAAQAAKAAGPIANIDGTDQYATQVEQVETARNAAKAGPPSGAGGVSSEQAPPDAPVCVSLKNALGRGTGLLGALLTLTTTFLASHELPRQYTPFGTDGETIA